MAKLKNPLFSLGATGRLARFFALAKRRGRHILEMKPIPADARSPAQLFNRHMFSKCVDLWHLLSEAEKQDWEALARPRHMAGYAWFVSQCLRPNPGIYLPLQGGTMSGDIDMAKNRLLKLPEPTDDQEAATKKYHDDNLPSGPYTEGCRVYHDTHQDTPDDLSTYLAFNSEDYDTHEMHDTVTNNERITIKTSGIYLVTAHIYFETNNVGYRRTSIYLSAGFTIADFRRPSYTGMATPLLITTIHQLTAGQYLRLRVRQNSGGILRVMRYAQYSPYFMAQRIG